MSITLGSGITLGAGMTLGAGTPTPPPPGAMTFNPAYNGTVFGGPALQFSNANLTVVDNGPGEYSTLTTVQFVPGNKYMASFTLDYYTDPVSWIGVANTNVDLQNGLGYDTNSIGFNSAGDYRYGGTTYGTGYCNFTNAGDIIDLAVDTSVNLMWIRVNGGDWNNNPSANPVTQTNGLATGGLSNGYFALAVGGYNFYSQFSINPTAQYSAPSGFTFLGGGYSFTITSSRLTGAGAFAATFSGVSTSGFTIVDPNVGNSLYPAYYATVTDNDADIIAAFTGAGEQTNYDGYIWNVSWGAGSTSNTLAKVSYNSGTKQIYMLPVDPASSWTTPGASGYSLAGTFNFPVTFTAYLPPVNKTGWC